MKLHDITECSLLEVNTLNDVDLFIKDAADRFFQFLVF